MHAMLTILSILTGILAAPIGSVLAILLVYGVLILRGRSEDQGRRGLLAGVLGIVPGAIVGFSVGMTLANVGATHPLAWLAHLGAALLGAIAVGTIGLIIGTHCAEARGVTNYAGERAA
jgi:hypothetical protein